MTWVYICVVEIFACPSIVWTARRSAPRSSRCVAKECLSTWGDMFFPMPALAGKLAEAFGVRVHNGYALDPQAPPGLLVFKRDDKALADHPVTRGRSEKERIDSVATFTGSAFQIERGDPILTFLGAEAISYTPKAFGQRLDKDTPRVPIKGWHQGVVKKVGQGRVAIFGEAAMFSAQLAGAQKRPMGMNAPVAKQNPQFLLNVMHWLSGLLEN